MPWEVRKKEDKFCVYKKGTNSEVACHATREEATKQVRALYAKMASEEPLAYLLPLREFSVKDRLDENGLLWLQAYPYDTWSHPIYGDTTVDKTVAEEMVRNFENKVYNDHIHTNYEHGLDPSKGTKASGEVQAMEARDDGLWYGVKFTQNALREIDDGEWNYWSSEHYDTWEHPQTGEVYSNVARGGALTNQPWIKGMAPLNHSELAVEVEPRITKEDSEVTEAELRALLGIGEDVDLKEHLQSLTTEHKEFSETVTRTREALELDANGDLVDAATQLLDEVKPIREAASNASEEKKFSEMFPREWEEMQTLKRGRIESDAREFSERYERFTKKDGDKEVKSNIGFPAVTLEKIKEVHKAFSERKATSGMLGELLDLVANQGFVDFSERGSARTGGNEPLSGDPMRAFAMRVAELQEKDGLEYGPAVKAASKQFPEEFEAYNEARNVRASSR